MSQARSFSAPVGVRHEQPAPPRRTALVGGLLVLLVLAGLAVALRWLSTVEAIHDGQSQLSAAQQELTHLKGTPTQIQVDRIDQRLAKASVDLGPRSSLLDSAGELRLASRLPWLRSQVSAVQSLRHTGLAAITAAQTAMPLVHRGLDPHSGDTLTAVLSGVDPQFLSTEDADLLTLKTSLAQAHEQHLTWPFSGMQQHALTQADRVSTDLSTALRAGRILHTMLGPGDHTYLILLGNPAEIRPGGGFVGVIGVVKSHDSAITSTQFRTSYFRPSKVTNLQAPRALNEHLFVGRPWELPDSNWSADFPTSAAQFATFYRGETGQRVDGVLGLSTATVSDMLRVTGTIHVPGYRQVVAPDKALVELSSIANKVRPGDPGKSYLTAFGHALLDRTRSLPASRLPALGKVFAKGAANRDLLVWAPAVTSLLPQDLQGALVPQKDTDTLLVTDANLSGSKNNLFVQHSDTLTVTQSANGSATHTLTLHYFEPKPVTAQDKGLLDNHAERGYRDYVEVRVPLGSQLTGMTLTDARGTSAIGPEAIDTDHGFTRFGYFLLLPLGTHESLTVSYRTTAGFDRFLWLKQLQALPHPVAVHVTWADNEQSGATRSLTSQIALTP